MRALLLLLLSLAGPDNVLTPAEHHDGWQLLFDGSTLQGWTWSLNPNPPEPSWAAEGGTLRTTPGKGKPVYLLTRESFTDFELSFEWKAGLRANSGIKYRFQGYGGAGKLSETPVEPEGKRIEPTGLEYQIADDESNPDAISDAKHSTAALYEYIEARKTGPALPNLWHRGRILARGMHIEHWLDGHKVVDIDLDSAEAEKGFGASKRRSAPLLRKQQRRESPIALQYHDGDVWFRNLKIRRLDGLRATTGLSKSAEESKIRAACCFAQP